MTEALDYDGLADVRGVGRADLEARVKLLAARAKELEVLLAAARVPGGPIGPSGSVWIGETRPSLEALAAALPGVGANGPTGV